jgi:hypothetical protein
MPIIIKTRADYTKCVTHLKRFGKQFQKGGGVDEANGKTTPPSKS